MGNYKKCRFCNDQQALAADINQQAENWRFLGQIRYDFASVLEILFSEKHYGIVHLDDHTIEGEITIVIGCNGHYFGAGMMGTVTFMKN